MRMFIGNTKLFSKILIWKCSALSNDNTSEEGKEHAREQLKALGDNSFDYESKIPEEQYKDPKNVAAGLKAYV